MEQKKTRHAQFWQGKLQQPLMGFFIPYDTGSFGPDCLLSGGEIVEKNRKWADFMATVPDDRVTCVWVNYGPVFLAALAGADVEWDSTTSWSKGHAEFMADVSVARFDPGHPLWRAYVEKFEVVKSADWRGQAIVGLTDFIGPFDILAALAGTETLCREMLLDPEGVALRAEQCTDFWLACYDAHYRILPEQDGTTECFSLFCPGRGARWSEDFIALIGPDMYRDFVLPHDCRLAASLDTSYMHVHSAGIRCLEHILAIPELSGVEISNDPNGPPLEAILEWAQEAGRRGKSVLLSNWNKNLTRKDAEMIRSRIDPSRTFVTMDAATCDEARAWRQFFGCAWSE